MWKSLIEFWDSLWKAAPTVDIVKPAAAAPQPDVSETIDPEQLKQLLGVVSELTTAVAQDVGDHNKSIEAISNDLRSVAENNPAAAAALVCKLLVANQQLQGRLTRAEGRLQMHSRELREAVTSARTDSLTGLMNRRALEEKLSECVELFRKTGTPATLMFLDVDRFKHFNDTYGHLIGDKCLIHVAAALSSKIEATDCLGRFGGEEFVAIFCGRTIAEVRQRAEMMRRSIRQRPIIIEGCCKPVTASGGLAELSAGETVVEWIQRADVALYAAKAGGRDLAYEMNGSAAEKIALAGQDDQGPVAAKNGAQRPIFEAAAEIAAEAFADTSFVPSVARRIAEWRRGGTTLTVMLARLDCFDEVRSDVASDDQHGAMRIAMHATRACLREMDMITRWQSDGIAVLLPNTSARDTKTVARRLKQALAADPVGGHVSLSMGIAEGIEGNDAKRVLERAWVALEAASSAGAGSVAVHDGLKAVLMKAVAAAK
jgi:diguanylate cyclase (GGDEF)-like protein